MNVHRCSVCDHGYWVNGDPGEMVKLPKHRTDGRVVKKGTVDTQCPGSRQPALVERPPNVTVLA